MVLPWSALTATLARPLGSDGGEEHAQEAWLETAARLDLVRLGFVLDDGPDGGSDPWLAYPSKRAVARWRATAALSLADPHGDDEEIVTVRTEPGLLVAGRRRGAAVPDAELVELARLGSALAQRRRDATLLDTARERARRGRSAAAAVHDVRNELTRALMYAARGAPDDMAELEGALASAREVAQSALAGADVRASLRRVPLADLVAREARTALGAVRRPDESTPLPALRVRCAKSRTALLEAKTFGRALRNLVTNAAEATLRAGAGGTVSVGVWDLGEGPGHAGGPDRLDLGELVRAGFDTELVVEDDGVGMSRAALARFLEPRPRAEHETSAGALASTGFGTASLELALEASGLPLRVESAPLQGTRITLFLRSTQPEEVCVETDARRAERRARPGRAMVATAEAAALLGA